MYATPVRTAATLLDTIEACVAPVLIVITGTWAPYRNCETMNYIHQTVNHTENLDPTTGAHTQTIGSFCHVYKMQNKRQCGTHRSFLGDGSNLFGVAYLEKLQR